MATQKCLHIAVQDRHHEIVAVLLKSAARVVQSTAKAELHCIHAYTTAATSLILTTKPELINAVDKEGKTALHYACTRHNDEAVVDLLLAANPELVRWTRSGCPLYSMQSLRITANMWLAGCGPCCDSQGQPERSDAPPRCGEEQVFLRNSGAAP